MTQFEDVWSHVKAAAQKMASTQQTLSMHHAEDIVRQIIRDERAEMPPADAIEYLAHEFRRFVEHFRATGPGVESRGAQEPAIHHSSPS